MKIETLETGKRLKALRKGLRGNKALLKTFENNKQVYNSLVSINKSILETINSLSVEYRELLSKEN